MLPFFLRVLLTLETIATLIVLPPTSSSLAEPSVCFCTALFCLVSMLVGTVINCVWKYSQTERGSKPKCQNQISSDKQNRMCGVNTYYCSEDTFVLS